MRSTCEEKRPNPWSLLIVDDDSDVRNALSEALEEKGFSVHQVTNGKEAINCITAGYPASLILLDLRMPVMDGYAFLAHRQKETALASIPVIVISATVDRLINRTDTEVVGKTVDIDALISLIRRRLEPSYDRA